MSSILRKPHWLGMGGVALAAMVLTAVLFGPVLLNPNDFYFNPGGDMLQSYYVTAFYAMFDEGARFTGMNYPYGEHFNYPNLQPLVAATMGFLQRHGVPAARYTVGITNLLALSSLVITPGVLYAVLRRTRLPVLYAGLLALIIGFMSPQVLRLDGHLSLSYAWFVPWLWYCIIRMQEAPSRWRWYAVFIGSILLIGAVMPYFLALGCAFLLGHVLVLAWQQPAMRRWLGRLVLAAVLPLLLFRGYLWATDHVTDRPPNPYGLLVFVATPSTVFMPIVGPFHDWWQEQWPSEGDSVEGYAYVGLVSTLALAASLVLGTAVVLARRQWRRLGRPAVPLHLRTGLWAASLLLIFSFGVPFKWHGFGWLTEHAGQVKQFRSLGRFAWPFYYVGTTYTAYCLYRLWRYLRLRRLGALALMGVTLLLFWGVEAWLQVTEEAAKVMTSTGASAFLDPATNLISRLTWNNRRISDFQAILPLPYYNIGTDKFDLSGSGQSIFQAYKASATSGLPLLANHTPRSSVGQALQHVQLFSSPMVPKELLAHFPNNKPLLLLVTPDYLTEAEQRLVSLAHLLVQTPEASLYELPVAALAATALPRERAKADSLLRTLKARPGGIVATTPAGVLVQGFDKAPDRRGRLGAGAFYEPKDQFSTLYDGPVPAPADTGRYEASVWINGQTAYGFGNMRVKMYYADGHGAESVVDSRKANEVQGDWVRIVVPFRVQPGLQRIEVLYENHDLLADDLLIRPVGTDVYYYTGTGTRRRLIKNTYPLTP
ncbi:hypothetical protein [Hymenobacter armeniacus]|uniref:DUF6311 domain-containing protein n=1 Tax=Hymenobacter armeniacus TaxID=2771358 RepID=A0ABR8JXA3_9BACT|nr:hypothetical protein [Hymenobacter armeniacus]MBD2723436.1 hypothetical protein [Hymenobacter armeniacus]